MNSIAKILMQHSPDLLNDPHILSCYSSALLKGKTSAGKRGDLVLLKAGLALILWQLTLVWIKMVALFHLKDADRKEHYINLIQIN